MENLLSQNNTITNFEKVNEISQGKRNLLKNRVIHYTTFNNYNCLALPFQVNSNIFSPFEFFKLTSMQKEINKVEIR